MEMVDHQLVDHCCHWMAGISVVERTAKLDSVWQRGVTILLGGLDWPKTWSGLRHNAGVTLSVPKTANLRSNEISDSPVTNAGIATQYHVRTVLGGEWVD